MSSWGVAESQGHLQRVIRSELVNCGVSLPASLGVKAWCYALDSVFEDTGKGMAPQGHHRIGSL